MSSLNPRLPRAAPTFALPTHTRSPLSVSLTLEQAPQVWLNSKEHQPQVTSSNYAELHGWVPPCPAPHYFSIFPSQWSALLTSGPASSVEKQACIYSFSSYRCIKSKPFDKSPSLYHCEWLHFSDPNLANEIYISVILQRKIASKIWFNILLKFQVVKEKISHLLFYVGILKLLPFQIILFLNRFL